MFHHDKTISETLHNSVVEKKKKPKQLTTASLVIG